MAVRVTFDQAKINKLTEAALQALEMTAEAVLSEIVSDQVVPKDKGILERGGEVAVGSKKAGTLQMVAFESGYVDKSRIKRGKVAVTFHTPYARRLYWHPEYNFRTDNNPNARGKWMHMYLEGGSKDRFAQKAFTRFLRKLSRGLIG